MKLKVYYAAQTQAPSFRKQSGKIIGADVDEPRLVHRLVCSGSDRDLNFRSTKSLKALESVFGYLNRREPNGFIGEFRSLSIGDVVCLEDRCYICQTIGWREFNNFVAE